MSNGTRGRKVGQGSKWIRRSTRFSIYHRDGFKCAYCQASAGDGAQMTLDHVLPCELGGTNAVENLVTACLSCNSRKQDKSMRDWLASLRDRGVDTSKIALRIRKLTATTLNRAEGRRLAV